MCKDWDHLRGMKFPEGNRKRQRVDLLIGIDNLELHTSVEERHCRPGEPVARLTPLGWTCVGKLSINSKLLPRGDQSCMVIV